MSRVGGALLMGPDRRGSRGSLQGVAMRAGDERFPIGSAGPEQPSPLFDPAGLPKRSGSGLPLGSKVALAYLAPAATGLFPMLGLGRFTAPAFLVASVASAEWLRRRAPAAWL